MTWQFTADNKAIRTVGRDGVVAEWKGAEFQQKDALFTVPNLDSDIRLANYFVQFSKDARFVAVGSETGKLQVWDVERRRLWREFLTPAAIRTPVAFLDNNTRLLICERSSEHFKEYDLVTGREIASWAGPAGMNTFGTGVTPDEQLVLTIGREGNALCRNRLTGAIERSNLEIALAEAPQFSPDGRYFSTGSRTASPKIWETSTRREVAELAGSVEFVSVAFRPMARGSPLVAAAWMRFGFGTWQAASRC